MPENSLHFTDFTDKRYSIVGKHGYYFFYIIALNLLMQPQCKQRQWRKMKSSLLAAGNKNMGL